MVNIVHNNIVDYTKQLSTSITITTTTNTNNTSIIVIPPTATTVNATSPVSSH